MYALHQTLHLVHLQSIPTALSALPGTGDEPSLSLSSSRWFKSPSPSPSPSTRLRQPPYDGRYGRAARRLRRGEGKAYEVIGRFLECVLDLNAFEKPEQLMRGHHCQQVQDGLTALLISFGGLMKRKNQVAFARSGAPYLHLEPELRRDPGCRSRGTTGLNFKTTS